MGKVVSGVVETATEAGAKVAVLAGQVLLEPAEFQKFGITEAIGLMTDEMTLDYAMQNGRTLLAQAAKNFTAKYLSN